MKAVGRLLLAYFFGTTVTRWLTIGGLLLIFASLYVVLYLPQTEHMLALVWPGIIAIFLGGSLMPLTFGRLSRSHAACMLPGARIKLLASALFTVLLVALPVGLVTPLAYVAGMSASPGILLEDRRLFEYTLWLALFTYTSACIAATWLYVFTWFVSSERNLAGFTKGIGLLIVLALIPSGESRDEGPLLERNLQHLAVLAVVFSAGYLNWTRLRRWLAGRRRAPSSAPGVSTREFAGREIDLLLGNTRPWILIVVLLLPLAFALRTGWWAPVTWLLYLAIASVVAGGNAEKAPARSRALWLRSEGPRDTLFAVVEQSAWRHNGLVLLALILFLLAMGAYAGMPPSRMLAGMSLVVLGTVLSTYLGLMLTRGVRVPESLLAIVVMLALLVVAVVTARDDISFWIVAAALAAMAALAVMLRSFARNRWARIDWSLCRRDAQAAPRV
jgi:hypothetical protein